MNELIQLLIRHGLASAGGFFAAHNITGDTTTSIFVGLILCAIPTVWSWAEKVLHLKGGLAVTGSEGFRILVGSLVSQGVTALSVYFAVDANNPELLIAAVVNAGASKLGLHQKAVGMPGAVKALALMGMLSLSSCTGVTAFLASPAGQATIALADLGLNAAAAKGKISPGDNVAIQRGLAIVTNPADPTSLKVFSLAELGLSTAVSKGIIKQGDALLIQEAGVIIKSAVIAPQLPSAKQPVNVLPATAMHSGQECPRSSPAVPACLVASCDFRHAATAAHDAQGDPAMPPSPLPAMKQSAGGVSIPLYGAAVAARLASAN